MGKSDRFVPTVSMHAARKHKRLYSHAGKEMLKEPGGSLGGASRGKTGCGRWHLPYSQCNSHKRPSEALFGINKLSCQGSKHMLATVCVFLILSKVKDWCYLFKQPGRCYTWRWLVSWRIEKKAGRELKRWVLFLIANELTRQQSGLLQQYLFFKILLLLTV